MVPDLQVSRVERRSEEFGLTFCDLTALPGGAKPSPGMSAAPPTCRRLRRVRHVEAWAEFDVSSARDAASVSNVGDAARLHAVDEGSDAVLSLARLLYSWGRWWVALGGAPNSLFNHQ